jgi:hypothetical protein
MFGLVISVSGLVFTPIGGLLIDSPLSLSPSSPTSKSTGSSSDLCDESASELEEGERIAFQAFKETMQINKICIIIYWSSLFGTLLLCFTSFFVRSRFLFLIAIAVGCGFLFLTSSAIGMGTMLAVPADNRSFGIAITTVFIHLFGDVPSPVLTGVLKDHLAPACASSTTDVECRAQQEGQRWTLFLVFLWCYLSVCFFWLAWHINCRSIIRYNQKFYFQVST